MANKTFAFYICLGLFFTSLASCDKLEEVFPKEIADNPAVKPYTIKKGQHYSVHSLSKTAVSQLKFLSTFDSSAIYTTKDNNNQADINKLYGISDCSSPHQENSARFGWRWLNNNLEIMGYTYVNGKRNFKFITSVAFNEAFSYELQVAPEQYIFTVNGTTITMDRHCTGNAIGYMLYPYFGGDEPAPHDITILIEDLSKD